MISTFASQSPAWVDASLAGVPSWIMAPVPGDERGDRAGEHRDDVDVSHRAPASSNRLERGQAFAPEELLLFGLVGVGEPGVGDRDGALGGTLGIERHEDPTVTAAPVVARRSRAGRGALAELAVR
jgi:hypothetical protein